MSRLMLLWAALAPTAALAQDHVLFVDFGGAYSADGRNMHTELLRLDPAAVYVNLATTPGAAAAALALETFEQVWVYDLSTGADAYATDFDAIATWYAQSSGEVIADGRFLSSFWFGRATGEGRVVTENYYTNLMLEGGGLVLATDHDQFSNAGINVLNAQLGFGPFTGNFGGSFPVDTSSPLMNNPNTITSLFNDSSTGQAPFGLQPNGVILDAVGYHSGNTATPGISSTIDGALNLVVTIDAPADGAVICTYETADAMASATGVTGAVTFTWESDVDGVLGGGASLVLDGAALTPGPHTLRVIAQDSLNIDDADVTIEVGGATCDDDGDGVPNGQDLCTGDDATGDSDGDGTCDDLDLTLEVSDDIVVGAPVDFVVSNAPAGAEVIIMGTRFGTGAGPCAPLGQLCVDLLGPEILLTGTADAAGSFTGTRVAPRAVGRAGTVWFQAFWYDPVTFEGDVTEVEARDATFP